MGRRQENSFPHKERREKVGDSVRAVYSGYEDVCVFSVCMHARNICGFCIIMCECVLRVDCECVKVGGAAVGWKPIIGYFPSPPRTTFLYTL